MRIVADRPKGGCAMTGQSERAMLWLVPVLMMLTAPTVFAQRPAPPLPSGNAMQRRVTFK